MNKKIAVTVDDSTHGRFYAELTRAEATKLLWKLAEALGEVGPGIFTNDTRCQIITATRKPKKEQK